MKRLLLLALMATSARAATFLIPSDRELVKAAKAIVVATAGESAGRRAPGGWIETVTALRVDEAIKGPVAAGQTIHVTELGGRIGSTGYLVPGSPAYAPGERVLLFLDTNARGEWVSKAMAVGKFTARGDRFLRAQLCGWNYDGTAHEEPVRAREKFLGFVRDVARGVPAKEDYVIPWSGGLQAADVVNAAASLPSAYLLRWPGAQGNLGIRWNKFPASVVFYSHGTQPGALDGGVTAVQRALSAWTGDGGSNIVYTYGGTTAIGSAGFAGNDGDGTNGIFFNDPAEEIPGAFNGVGGDVLGIGGGWFNDASVADTHNFGGERFYTIYEADLVLQNGIFGAGLSGNGFDHLVTHELGHTLGLRHSDEASPFSSSAIMASSVAFNSDPYGSSLQQWDREAIGAAYGTAVTPDPCKPPTITGQPQSAVLASQAVTLSVSAIGDAPLRYQWYSGARGNTANPVGGATSASVSVQPAVTTVYWCRISNGCDPSVDSAAATVTVNGCPAVTVDSISPNADVIEGTKVTLTATATGATSLQWYSGVSGTTTSPLAGMTTASIEVTPALTTSYWVRASNSCGAFANSETVIVVVRPCTAPAITAQPGGVNVVAGNAATLYIGVNGSQPLTILWYEGARGDTSHPVPNGNSPLLITPPLFAPTSFWVRATNLCGTVNSDDAPVGIVASCTAPVITAQPHDAAVPSGKSAVLSVAATGTALTYQWYEGPVLDFNRPRGGSAPSFTTGPITGPTQFWVRVAGQCGVVNSVVANVTVAAAKRRAAGR